MSPQVEMIPFEYVRSGLVVLLALTFAGSASAQPGTQILTHALDSAARAHVANPLVPGVSVAVVRGGEVLLKRGYGFVDLEWGVRLSLIHI